MPLICFLTSSRSSVLWMLSDPPAWPYHNSPYHNSPYHNSPYHDRPHHNYFSAIAFLGHARKNTSKNAHKNALHYARHNQLENIDNLRTYTPLHSPLHFVHTLCLCWDFTTLTSCNDPEVPRPCFSTHPAVINTFCTHLTLQQNE